MIIRVAHIRASGLCMNGARDWFESHGINWNDFLENGATVEFAKSLNDPLADRVVEIVESLEAKNG